MPSLDGGVLEPDGLYLLGCWLVSGVGYVVLSNLITMRLYEYRAWTDHSSARDVQAVISSAVSLEDPNDL